MHSWVIHDIKPRFHSSASNMAPRSAACHDHSAWAVLFNFINAQKFVMIRATASTSEWKVPYACTSFLQQKNSPSSPVQVLWPGRSRTAKNNAILWHCWLQHTQAEAFFRCNSLRPSDIGRNIYPGRVEQILQESFPESRRRSCLHRHPAKIERL